MENPDKTDFEKKRVKIPKKNCGVEKVITAKRNRKSR